MSTPTLMTLSKTRGQFQIHAEGSWTAPNAQELESILLDLANQTSETSFVGMDMAAVTDFDTYGAWLLERFRRDLVAAGGKIEITGMEDRSKPLFNEVGAVNQAPASDFDPGRSVNSWMQALFIGIIGFGREMLALTVMFGAVINVIGRVIAHPSNFRLTSTIHQLDRVGWKALPIVLLITFIIGAIIAQQGFFHFAQFGADHYVIDMVGFLTMRELGVLLVAIVVAGRSASSYTAELGTMKMREEIDALKTMGYDPVEILILPRILVLILALPILTFIGSLAALFGAGLVATFYADINPEFFVDRIKNAISIDHFMVGMIKAPFMGVVIGVIACSEGLQVKGSASSLGIHTTQSVVKSIFMVILLDGLFAMFFSSIGM